MIVHHYGIVVDDINKSIPIYLKLGYNVVSEIIIDEEQHNKVVFLSNQGLNIELIEPIDNLSTVNKAKIGYHHICYESNCDEDIVGLFKEMKIGKIFTPPIMAPALNNRKVVFACLQNGTFIEFILS